jgi:hypothetical protein
VVEVAEVTRGHDHARARLTEDEPELGGPVDRHHRAHDGAELHDRMERDKRLPPVRELHQHDITRTDTGRDEPARDAIGVPPELLL